MKIPRLQGGFPHKRQFTEGQQYCKVTQSPGTMFYVCTTMKLRSSEFAAYRFEAWYSLDIQVRLSQKERASDRWLFDLSAKLPTCLAGGGKGVNYTNRGMVL